MKDSARFEFGVKAVNITEEDDGTIILEGLASDFSTDRDLEAFDPGAFQKGLKAFMDNPVLLYHHDPKKQLGLVTDTFLDRAGLHIKAVIPKPPEGEYWAAHVYNLVKRGMMRGFSVGGQFFRHNTAAGPRIHTADLQEISVTPLPVNPRTLFATAGKAFESLEETPQTDDDRLALLAAADELAAALERVRTERAEAFANAAAEDQSSD